MVVLRSLIILFCILLQVQVAQAANPCGMSPGDWCTKPSDGPCGRHIDAVECRADPACSGMEYSGESAIACHWDKRGFADNCPTVGCLAR
jgi:hypothetical protein